MKKFFDMQDQDWRIQVDTYDGNAEVVRPDKDRPGYTIGPLAIVPAGMTEEDDDGDLHLLLDSDDGRNVYAIANLPKIAATVAWALDALGDLNSIHFDTATDSGRFHRELRDRLETIVACIDCRPAKIGEGTHSMR